MNTVAPLDLHKTFRTLVWGWGKHPHIADELWEPLDTHYREPHRAYHNWQHIAVGLRELKGCQRDTLPSLSYFYHDAIYNTRNADGSPVTDNEARSAELFRSHARRMNLDKALTEEGVGLIIVTDHKTPPTTDNEKLIVDVDLSILGAQPETFASYCHNIRKEYDWVPADVYAQHRAKVLSMFLGRAQAGTLYHTERFRSQHTARAITNLGRAIAELGINS